MPDTSKGAEAALLAADSARLKAMVASDAKALDGLFHGDLRFIHSTGVIDSKDSYLEKMRAGSAYKVAERRDVAVNVRGDVAWLTGGVHLGIQRGTNPRTDLELRYVSVWVQDGGKWKLHAYCSTPAPKA